MKRRIIEIGLLISLLLVYKTLATEETFDSSYPPPPHLTPSFPLNSSPVPLRVSPSESVNDSVYSTAKAVTVKILSGPTGGSGVLIRQVGSTYWVVTNHHVLVFGQSQQNYQIITPDGQKHSAKVLMNGNNGQDLAILTFESSRSYQIASLSSSRLVKLGEQVFAAGFPSESDRGETDNFLLNQGNVALFSSKPFGGGYEIGYTNSVKKGMSGGPVFNRLGEIIGLNGVHKYPLWGNPYNFSDGSQATPSQKQEMSQYSWAIPIQTLQQWLKSS